MITPEVRAAAEAIHDALDAMEDCGYHNRNSGILDLTSDELAEALLLAGWLPPSHVGIVSSEEH